MSGREKACIALKSIVDAINCATGGVQIVEIDDGFVMVDINGNVYPQSASMAGAICNAFIVIFGGMAR